MKRLNVDCISSRAQYDTVRARLDELIKEATRLGLLESGMDNEYIKEIGRLAKLSAEYEDNELNLLPLRQKNPLIQSIEDFSYSHNIKRKEVAELLDLNESVFSQIMSGKRKISMDLAKKLYRKLNIDPKTILENA